MTNDFLDELFADAPAAPEGPRFESGVGVVYECDDPTHEPYHAGGWDCPCHPMVDYRVALADGLCDDPSCRLQAAIDATFDDDYDADDLDARERDAELLDDERDDRDHDFERPTLN